MKQVYRKYDRVLQSGCAYHYWALTQFSRDFPVLVSQLWLPIDVSPFPEFSALEE
jgi:hypothetical protein